MASVVRGRGRRWTLSIALPGSIIANAQTPELQTYLAGQVARAAAIYCVDEIVVFSDSGHGTSGSTKQLAKATDTEKPSSDPSPRDHRSVADRTDPDVFLARCLAFLETPQYLRRHLFPMHQDLKFAGLLNPLDAPHHLRIDEVIRWREGVVVPGPSDGRAPVSKNNESSVVDVGFNVPVRIRDGTTAPVGARVTVDLGDPAKAEMVAKKRRRGDAPMAAQEFASPDEPRERGGFYWGYRTRLAGSLSSVFRGDTWNEGYDVVMGTSERGVPVTAPEVAQTLSGFKRLLLVFGGVAGLEESAKWDPLLKKKGCGASWKVDELFDVYVNTCPSQGSRTIRTEEALLISLAALKPLIDDAQLVRGS